MADLLETPQYKLPFRLVDGEPATHEQDSTEDRMQNAVVALRYVQGTRSAMPKYGLPDQALKMGGADTSDILRTVRQWEPDVDIEAVRESLEDGVDTIGVNLGDPSNG